MPIGLADTQDAPPSDIVPVPIARAIAYHRHEEGASV